MDEVICVPVCLEINNYSIVSMQYMSTKSVVLLCQTPTQV